MRRLIVLLGVGFLICAGVSGCGPNVSDSDLGRVMYEVPMVAGADEPYRFPEGVTPPDPRSRLSPESTK